MCGIFGFYGFEDKQLLKQMSNILLSRGPDETGFYTDKNVGIGSNRLTIIDLETGKQPIFNEDRSVCMVANCEIYNHIELKLHLESKGHRFQTKSDAEVIVHAYEEWGSSCAARFHGAFSYCIYDQTKKRLVLARDQLGINPLFYHFDGESFIFASEIKAIIPSIKPCVSRKAVADFFTFMYVPGAKTLFEEVYCVLPRHVLIVNKEGITNKKYEDWNYEPTSCNPKSVAKMVEKAVQRRMMSDVPIGLAISGGIDSCSVAAHMSKLSNEPIKTYSIIFDEHEQKNIRIATEEYNTDHKNIHMGSESLQLIDNITRYNDALVADPTFIPQFLISRVACKDVKVLLTGSGADEILGGYGIFKMMKNSEYNPMHSRPEKRYWRYISLLRDDFSSLEKQRLLKDRLKYNPYSQLKKYFKNDLNVTQQVSKVLLNTYLPSNILLKVDQMFMANSIEGRVPFLDLDLVHNIRNLSENHKLKGNTEKWILREAMNGIVPERIRRQKKKPFSVPVEKIFGRDLYTTCDDAICQADLYKGYFNKEEVNSIFTKNKRNHSYSRQIWSLLCFSKWYEHYINRHGH